MMICEALEQGTQIIIAGRACTIQRSPRFPFGRALIWGLLVTWVRFSNVGAPAEPFAMDVMLGTIDSDHFVLEPGSLKRRASVKSVAAHSLYEREHPFVHGGPGHELDLSQMPFSHPSATAK